MAEGPEDVLKSTDNTQPALFTVSAMVMELLKSEGFAFDYVAGHSLGEYSAIYAAGGSVLKKASVWCGPAVN